MLPKEQRLINERDFKRVYRKGSFFSVGLFSVNFDKNRTSFTRVGIVISKKVAGKAVVRNKVKRKFREAVQKNFGKLPKGVDVIINIKGSALEAEFLKIETEVAKAFERIAK